MKLQHILPFLLASLIIANDDLEETRGALRGSTIRDSDGFLGVRKEEGGKASFASSILDDVQRSLQFILPELPSGNSPAAGPTVPVTEDETEEEATAFPTVSPTIFPMESPTISPTAAPTGPPQPFIIARPNQRPTIPVPASKPTLAPITTPFRPTVDGLLPPTPTNAPVFPTPPIREEATDAYGNACGMSTPGTLILHGGIFNYEDPMSDSLGQAFVREMRTNSDNRLMDPLVFLPGARREVTDQDEETFENQWRDIMADGVPFSVLHPKDQEPEFTNVADASEADTNDFVRPLRDAMGVFLPGGRQWRLIDAYKYTQTEEELWNILKRGGVIAGTSAGAAVMADFMPRGDPAGSVAFLSEREWYQHGFGFVSNIAVDNHVSARGRENAMYEAMNTRLANRKLLGIGLNENTMAIVKGRYFQVRGDRGQDSVVRVYDCSRINEFQTCDYENAPYTELTPGSWYDLCARRQLFSPPSFNDLDEDLGSRSRSAFGGYSVPWEFKKDFKSGGDKFLCSGRRCKFKSNPIIVNRRNGSPVLVSGKVYSDDDGFGFGNTDRLVVRYRVNDDDDWKVIFNSSVQPGRGNPAGQNIFTAISTPSGKSTVYLEIEAETSAVEVEFRVQDLKIQ